MWANSRRALILTGFLIGCSAESETPPASTPSEVPEATTKLESFRPAAGTLITFGYDELGTVGGIAVDVREMRADHDDPVRGLLVEVTESQYRQERAFIDADEVAELIGGLDALLEVEANPTTFKNFEVRYTTRGELRLTAFNNSRGGMSYSVEAGRGVRAQRFLNSGDLQRFRAMLVAGQTRLQAL